MAHADLHIQAINGGSGILTHTFMGTGSADGIVSRASLKMTAFSVNIDGDYNRDGTPDDHADEADPVFFTNTVGMVILPNNNDNTDDNIPNIDCADNIINGLADLPDIYPLSISRLGISADAISDRLTFELRVSGTGDDPAGAPVPKERVRIFPSRTANAVGAVLDSACFNTCRGAKRGYRP